MRKRWKAHYTRNLDSLASKLNAFNLEKERYHNSRN